MPNFITKKISTKYQEYQADKKRQQQEAAAQESNRKYKAVIDSNAHSEEYWNSYRKGAHKREKTRGSRDAMVELKQQPQAAKKTQSSSRGDAALAGLNFLSGGGGFGGNANGTQISDNINDLLGFGGPTRSSNQQMPKAKRTTIHTGGKTITISDKEDSFNSQGPRKKRESSFSEDIEKLMNKEFDY